MISKFFNFLTGRIRGFDYFGIGIVLSAWFLSAYVLSPLAILSGIRTTYLNYIVGQEIDLYTPLLFIVIATGFVCFWLGYFASKLLFRRKNDLTPAVTITVSNWYKKAVFVLTALGVIAKVYKLATGTYSHLNKNQAVANAPYAAFVGLADTLAMVGLGMAWAVFFYYRRQGDRRKGLIWGVAAWSLLVLEFLFGFFSLSKAAVLLPTIVFLVINHYLGRKSLVRVLSALVILQLVIFPIQSNLSAPHNMVAYRAYWRENRGVTNPIVPIADFVGDGIFGRLDLSRATAKIIAKLSVTNDFWGGRSLKNFFISLGPPRILWPSKPLVDYGHNEFGREFGILAQNDYTTAVAPGFIGDFYLNFGLHGVAFGTLISGMLLGFLWEFFRRRKKSPYWVGVYGALLPQVIMAQEGWIGPSMAGIVKIFIMFLFFAVSAGIICKYRFLK